VVFLRGHSSHKLCKLYAWNLLIPRGQKIQSSFTLLVYRYCKLVVGFTSCLLCLLSKAWKYTVLLKKRMHTLVIRLLHVSSSFLGTSAAARVFKEEQVLTSAHRCHDE
jgi:hypothetical protein